MTPMHPKLLKMLLADEKHFRLTPALLNQYEALIAEVYDKKNNSFKTKKQKNGSYALPNKLGLNDLLKKIKIFRDSLMPNYSEVVSAWAKSQKRAILSTESNTDSVKSILPLIILWIIWISLDMKYALFEGHTVTSQCIILLSFVGLYMWRHRKNKFGFAGVIAFFKSIVRYCQQWAGKSIPGLKTRQFQTFILKIFVEEFFRKKKETP